MKLRECLLNTTCLAAGEQRGAMLIGTLVALALLAICGGVFLGALSTSSKTSGIVEEKVNVHNLARSQMEYTKNSDYIDYDYGALPGNPGDDVPPNYAITDVALPPGYSINVAAVEAPVAGDPTPESDDGIQEISVTISHNGETVFSLAGYKVRR